MAQNFQDALDKAFPADKPASTSSGAAPSGGSDSRVAAFARDVGPLAARVGEEIGVDPKILIGQWGLETGWGKSVIPGTNNYGNIKDFRGSGVVARDNMNGSVDKYRAFASPDEFGAHFAGLMSRKYGAAMNLGDNALAYGNALRRGGYAEDPNYAVKIANAADMVRKATGGKSQPELYAPRGQYIGQTEKVLADAKKREEIANEGYGTAFGKGFGDATDQIPELAVGAGTALADVFGLDELRDAGLGYLQKRKDESQDEARSYSSFTDSLENGDMGRWAAYAMGYGLNQLGQAALTGGIGATVGKVGLTGLLKGTAERVTAEALAKGATQELASKAGMEAAELAAKKYGAAFAMYGNTYGQELGSIYPDAVEQAKKSGNPVDLAKVFGSAGVAAALEAAPEIGIAGKLIDGAGKGSKRMLGRAAGTIPKQMGLEGGTEYAQTGVEQWGAQKPLDTAEARKERIDSAAMGAIMGGPAGAIEAVPAPRADAAPGAPAVTPAGPAPRPTPQPNSPLSNAAAAGQSAQPAQYPASNRMAELASKAQGGAFLSPEELAEYRALQEQENGLGPLPAKASAEAAAQAPEGGLTFDALLSVRDDIDAKMRNIRAMLNRAQPGSADIQALRGQYQQAATERDAIEARIRAASAFGAINPTAEPAAKIDDPLSGRVKSMRHLVEDKELLRAMRSDSRYGKETVTDLLAAWAMAKNPAMPREQRERALKDIEAFTSSLVGPSMFIPRGQSSTGFKSPPGTQVAPIQQPGAVTTPAPRDDGRTLDGEIITRPEKMAGANPNQISAPPVLGLPTEEALKAKRDADAAYEQAYQDLVKAESLGAADAELQAKQQAIRDARAQSEQAEARLKEIEQAIEGNRAKQTAEKRRTILDAILADPNTANPAARLTAELARQGFRDTQPSADELAAIQRFEDIKAAQAEPEVIPSAPNEMEVYQAPVQRAPAPRPAPKQEAKPKQPPARRLSPMEIRAYVEAGAVLNGDTLTLKDGTTIKLKGPQIAAARQATSRIAPAQSDADRREFKTLGDFGSKPSPDPILPHGDTGSEKSVVDRSLADSVFFGNSENAEAIRVQGFDFVDRDIQRVVLAKVRSALNNAQILRIVVKAVPVDVMHMLIGRKRSPDDLLHDPSMLTHRLSVSGDVSVVKPVVRFIDTLVGLVELIPAGLIAKEFGLTLSSGAPSKDSSAKITSSSAGLDASLAAKMPAELGGRSVGASGENGSAGIAGEGKDGHVSVSIGGKVDTVNINTSDAQKAAGSYKKGHFRIQGMGISIENPQGSTRSGVSPDGKRWEQVLGHHYGYFTGTTAADGDNLDVFLTDGAEDAPVIWIIDQKNKDGSFDEHKTILGPRTEEDARAAYLANYEPGWDGLGAISSMPIEAFKAWAFDGKKKRKPLAYVEPAKEEAKPSDPREEFANQKEQAYIAKRGGSAPPKAVEAVRVGAYREYDRLNATHQDPGKTAEAATPAVVAESIKKSAANTPLNIKEARAALLSEIDAAIANVADKTELEAELQRAQAREFKPDGVLKRTGGAALRAAENDFEALKADAIAKSAKQIGFVTFDVPGDGKFKVVNTKAKLQEFRRKVETSPGFKDAPTKPPVMARDVVQGSYTPRDAILEGDYLNAYELAKLNGKPLVFSVSSGDVPSAYTDSATADGIIDGLAFVVAREAVKDGKWYVIDPATGMLLNKSGLPAKVAALTAAKAKVKGHEDALRKVVADPTKAMPQSTLEAQWLTWAEEKEGRKLGEDEAPLSAPLNAKDDAKEDAQPWPAETEGQADAVANEAEQKSITPDPALSDIFTGLSSRGLAKTRAEKAAAAHPRAEQIAYVQENFMDILTELEDAGIVKINCD